MPRQTRSLRVRRGATWRILVPAILHCLPCLAGTIPFASTDHGWFRSDGSRTQNQNTFTGVNGQGFHNTYFVFDLSDLDPATVLSATFQARISSYSSEDAVEPLSAFSVGTAIDALENLNISTEKGIAVHSDLQSGTLYGTSSIAPTNVATPLDLVFTAAGLMDIRGAAGNRFAVGIHLDEVQFVGGMANGLTFNTSTVRLVVETIDRPDLIPGPGGRLRFEAQANLVYRLEKAVRVPAREWIIVEETRTETRGSVEFIVTPHLEPPATFFRVRVVR